MERSSPPFAAELYRPGIDPHGKGLRVPSLYALDFLSKVFAQIPGPVLQPDLEGWKRKHGFQEEKKRGQRVLAYVVASRQSPLPCAGIERSYDLRWNEGDQGTSLTLPIGAIAELSHGIFPDDAVCFVGVPGGDMRTVRHQWALVIQ
jgi:hypothetical protein